MRRILIIDDDANFGANAVQMLESAGFNARFHRGPFGSLQAIRETVCELVLLDVNMPKLDGPLLVRMIRDAFGLGRIKVLLCSNMEPAPLERLAKAMGVHGAVPKSVPQAEIIDQVRAVLPQSPN
jgi:chemosensory pili system protein ChpA (sensor histidine kinase/response regulator)